MGKMHDKINRQKQAKMIETRAKEMAKMIEQAAMVAHEVNRAYCAAMGDNSQPQWHEAPRWQQESAFNGVVFHIENPDAGPEASHESWMKQKVFEGWVYGEVKDPDNKTHPCMVPFKDLPKEQQVKDHLFRAVVHSIMLGGE